MGAPLPSPKPACLWPWSPPGNLFVPWQLADWAELPATVPKTLVIAPWPHEHPKLKLYMREALAWLDTQLRAAPAALDGGPVRYFVTGVEEWRDALSWPPPHSVEQRWYLQPGGGLSTSEPHAQ